MSERDFETLRQFLEERDVSVRAAGPLKDSAVLRLTIVGDPQPYHISREGRRTRVKKGEAPKDPQISFTISPKAIEKLSAHPGDDIGEFGVQFFRLMVSDDPEEVLSVKLHTGFLGLMSMGVFGVLALGGGSVMAFLARHGFKSLKEIRRAVAKLRGGREE